MMQWLLIIKHGVGALSAKLDLAECLQAHTHQKPGLASFGLILGPPVSRWFYVPPLLCGPFSSIWAVQLPSPVQWIHGMHLQYAMKTNKVQDLLHYLDDYFTVGPPQSPVCTNNITTMIATCEELGFTVNSEKVTKPATTTNFLGIDIDSVAMEARIDPTHLSKTISLLKDIMGYWSTTKQSILTLIGKCHFMCHICRPGRAFLHCMIETSMKAWHLHHRIKLNQEFCRDIDWWLCYLPTWNGGQPFVWVPLAHQHGMSAFHWCQWHVVFSCYFQGHWCQGEFPEACFWDGPMSINWRELYDHHHGPSYLGDQFKGKRILVHCDNASVMQIMAKCSSRSKSMMVLVCSLAMFGMQNNFDLCLQHIPGVNNGIADDLSRFNNDQFWHLALDVDPSMMPLVSFPYQ